MLRLGLLLLLHCRAVFSLRPTVSYADIENIGETVQLGDLNMDSNYKVTLSVEMPVNRVSQVSAKYTNWVTNETRQVGLERITAGLRYSRSMKSVMAKTLHFA